MLRNIAIKHTYQYPEDNIAEDFYNRTLSVAKSYDRVSGYFSSKSLLQYTLGIEGLIKNKGKMRLVISHQVPEEDYFAITRGYILKEKYLNKFKEEITPLNNLSSYNSFGLLSYLISQDKLDIQVGFCSTGIFHSKFGIITDNENNKVMFMGSHNETAAGLNGNYEMFSVTASWLSSEFDAAKITDTEIEFDKLWNNRREGVVIVKEFSEIVREELKLYNPGRSKTKDGEKLPTADNSIILNRDKSFYLKEVNLKNKLDTKSFAFVFNLNTFFEDELYPLFRKDISPSDLGEFIEEFAEYCASEGINFIVDSSVYEWIRQNNYLIQERKLYGNIIKSKDDEILSRFENFKAIASEELERVLRPQQMWSAFYMTEMKKSANFSVPGAGKTSMVYGSFGYLSSQSINKVDRIIMIGPKNSFGAWKDEFVLNFGENRKLSVLDIHDENKNIASELIFNYVNYNLILINYESMRKYEDELKNIIDERTMLVFDEVHRIKAVDGKRAKSALEISTVPNYKFVLTGTPIPNGYIDVYNFLNILFDSDYNKFFEWTPKDLLNLSYYEVGEVNKKLAPFYWRTNKNELNVPPANTDNIIEVHTTSQEQDIIDMLYRKFYGNPLLLYIRLMQMSSNPALLLNNVSRESLWNLDLFEGFQLDILDEIVDDNSFTLKEKRIIEKVDKTGKYYMGIEKIKSITQNNEKIVVWCVFVDTIKSLVKDLNELGIKADSVHGSVDNLERTKILNNFKNGDTQVLVTNPHTLGEAISLHHTCHKALYMEYTFNLTHMLQSRDRIHRLGLKDNQETDYYYMMLKGQEFDTIDRKIYLRLKEKSEVMMKAIENNYLEPMPADTKKDILDLFS